jgi:anti-sigma regulatory factor (Ser/Thr protein kinase)
MLDHRLPHSAKAAPMARRLARDAAAYRMPPDRIDDFVLMTSEAVANAVLHAPPVADGSVGLRFETGDGVFRAVVTDGGHWFHPDGRFAGDGEASLHFGLTIIDELSSRGASPWTA